jgi:hypothetical protein
VRFHQCSCNLGKNWGAFCLPIATLRCKRAGQLAQNYSGISMALSPEPPHPASLQCEDLFPHCAETAIVLEASLSTWVSAGEREKQTGGRVPLLVWRRNLPACDRARGPLCFFPLVVEDDRSREEGKERNDMMASESFPPFYPEPSKNGRIKNPARIARRSRRLAGARRETARVLCGALCQLLAAQAAHVCKFCKVEKKWKALTARNT